MKIKKFLLFVLLFVVSILYAQNKDVTKYPVYQELVYKEQLYKKVDYKLFRCDEQKLGIDDKQFLKEGKYLSLNHAVLDKLIGNRSMLLEVEIPVDDEVIVLELFNSTLYSSDFVLETSNRRKYNNSNALFYRGTVKNNKRTIAAAYFNKDEVRILVSDENSNYRIQKVKNGEYLYFDEKNLMVQNELNCFSTDIEFNDKKINFQNTVKSTNQGNCVELYLECDYQTFLDNNEDVIQTENFVSSILNEVFTLYANENLTLVISEIFIWTSSDPYISTYNPIEMLYKFQEQKNANGYNGRLAHLLSTRSLGGGVAFRDVLCSETKSYGVSTSLTSAVNPFPEYSSSVYIVAHELGHNFGSPHTHDCFWNGNNTQIDDCGNIYGSTNECYDPENPILPDNGGTVMSYCDITGIGVNFLKGFGQQPGDLIRNRYNSSICTTGCSNANPPLPPTNVSCISLSATKMAIQWDKVEGAYGYKLFRAKGDSDNYLAISTTNSNDSSFIDIGLTPETNYCYKIKSYSDGGNSEFSAGDCETLPELMDIVIKVDSSIACPDTIVIPVKIKNAQDVYTFFLSLDFPNDSIDFLYIQNEHPSILNGNFAFNTADNRIIMYWTSDNSLSISDDILMDLVFSCQYENKSNPLKWDTTGTNCRFLDQNNDFLSAGYINGSADTYSIIESLEKPIGIDTVCIFFEKSTTYQSIPQYESTTYDWFLEPVDAGIIAKNNNVATVFWNQDLTLPLSVNLFVNASNECYDINSSPLSIFLPDSSFCGVGIEDANTAQTELNIYPNPFSASTIIEYEVQEKSIVQIYIYNNVGKLIKLIRHTETPGVHRTLWHSDNLPSGLYYCVVQIEGNDEFRKATILKE